MLLVKRNPSLAFMGGHHAFPGGGVSRHDTGARVLDAPDHETARSLVAAVREAFEETGLLLVEGALPDRERIETARHDLTVGKRDFESLLDAWQLHIRAADFKAAGHWITPSFSPMRFDTRYYLYRCDQRRPATPMGPEGEITAVDWLPPREALRLRAHGSMLLSTPVAFTLQRLAAFPLDTALARLQHTPGFSPILMDYIEPVPGVHIVPVHAKTLPPATHTNCIIIGERELAIVDPGVSEEEEQRRLMTHLDDMLETVNGKLTHILLTHNHPDHCAHAEVLSRHYAIPVCAHPMSLDGFSNSRAIADDAWVILPGDPPWRIRCLHTPGHHPGHVCYYEEHTGALLCGDIAANPGTIMVDVASGGDMNAYLDSLERLSALSPIMTVPGHGAPLPGSEGTLLFQKTIAHRHMREAKIIAALEQGATTMDALLARAYDDTPRELLPYAQRQLAAHLKRLGKDL